MNALHSFFNILCVLISFSDYSFSSFNLTFEDREQLRNETRKLGFSLTNNVINVWHSATALSKLRAYIYGEVDRANGRETYIKKGGMLINILTEYHYDKLTRKAGIQDITTIKKYQKIY